MFFKLFWIFEKLIFLLPTAPIKIWLGLWIMLPNFSGEFFIYNLLSDKLIRFEQEIRRTRNKFFAKVMQTAFDLASSTFKFSRPYIHTDNLKKFREALDSMHQEIDFELDIRKKITKNEGDGKVNRDSSVLNFEP